MRKKRDYMSRIPETVMVMVLSAVMTLSGIAPAFHAFAEDTEDEAAVQTEETVQLIENEAVEEAPAAEAEPETTPQISPTTSLQIELTRSAFLSSAMDS